MNINDIDWCKRDYREESMKTKLVEYAIGAHFRGFDGWRYLNQSAFIEELGDVTLVDVNLDYEFENTYNTNHLVFKVEFLDGTTRFFKMTGHADSYGNRDWDGRFVEVKPVQKTITAYDEV